ncbi:MAG: heme-binding protein [Pseudomonadota bacterium]
MEERVWERMWPPELPYDYAAMNLEKALALIEGSKKKSTKMGFAMTMAVCDAGGNMVALQRMDDAALLSLEIAQNKARTAVFGKIPTLIWGDFFKGPSPELSSLYFHSNWITFMGGFPVIMGGKLIGGFGCSGATWEDGPIARAGLAALGADMAGVDYCLEKFGIPKEKW